MIRYFVQNPDGTLKTQRMYGPLGELELTVALTTAAEAALLCGYGDRILEVKLDIMTVLPEGAK